jgi:single-strand DNA-binding protein
MFETTITMMGNVMDEVTLKATQSGIPRVSFRVVSTARRTDRETGEWVDGQKLIVNVTFWREFAENVAKSIRKGDPVLVYGSIFSREYTVEETNRISYEIEPVSIAHNLKFGTAKFDKRKRGLSGAVPVDADGLPAPLADEGYELVGRDGVGSEIASNAGSADRVLASASTR